MSDPDFPFFFLYGFGKKKTLFSVFFFTFGREDKRGAICSSISKYLTCLRLGAQKRRCYSDWASGWTNEETAIGFRQGFAFLHKAYKGCRTHQTSTIEQVPRAYFPDLKQLSP